MPFVQLQRIADSLATWLRPTDSAPQASPNKQTWDSLLTDMRGVASEEYGFVYVVTPKVACTSVKTALMPLFGKDPSEAGERGEAHKILARSGAVVSGDQLIPKLEESYRDYFKFSFVRNPYDRLVSCYYSKINPKVVGIDQEPHEGVGLRPGMTFKEFAEAVCLIPDEKANVHFRSQHFFLRNYGAGGEPLVNFVGRFEDMEEDFNRVAKKLGVQLSLPHSNPSKRRRQQDYRSFYDEDLVKMVGERYREDCEIFGYSFDKCEQRN